MSLRIYTCGETYYTRGLMRVGCLAWNQQGDQWVRDAAQMPADATEVSVGDLPTQLQEELLAFAARAEAMPGSGLSSPN